jgi:hypothetical protein
MPSEPSVASSSMSGTLRSSSYSSNDDDDDDADNDPELSMESSSSSPGGVYERMIAATSVPILAS